jgi:hypothetical protein
MILPFVKVGLATIRRQSRLCRLLWLITLCFAAMSTMPLFQWWKKALGQAPGADRILDGFHFQILRELIAYDLNSLWQIVFQYTGLLLLLTLLSSIFIAGGTLHILTDRESGLTIARFGTGAGRYFWRFFRLFLLWGVCLILLLILLVSIFSPLLSLFSDNGWEPTTFIAWIFLFILLAMVIGCFLVILDYARIRIVVDSSGSIIRSLFFALHFVLFQAPRALVVAAVFGSLSFVLWFFGYILSVLIARPSLLGILAMAVFHQILQLARSSLRIGMLGAHIDLFQKSRDQEPEVKQPLLHPQILEQDLPISDEIILG